MSDTYPFRDASPSYSSQRLVTTILKIFSEEGAIGTRVFDLGCGNGSTANMLGAHGYDVVGVDESESGVALANETFPNSRFYCASAYDDLAERFGTFPVVMSLEVIEHCYYPRKFARTFADLMEPGGLGLISTPYHGYMKNLVISLVNGWDTHWSPLWDHGHIKFFSKRTLAAILKEAEFEQIRFLCIGRIPPLARSMIAVVRKRDKD